MTNQTFIAAKDVTPDADIEDTFVEHPVEDWEANMAALSEQKTIRIPRKANRRKAQVVDALNDAFELIGGVPRLAVWADTNPSEFYRIWSKLAPKDVSTTVDGSAELKILHVLPPGKLDQ
jgi:hypothetical protein